MISYTPQNQLSLDLFKHPFKTDLNPKNRWVELATLIPWDDLAEIYAKNLQVDSGRKSIDIRTVIGALIIKHKLGLDDRGTIMMIQENPYLQYFCGLSSFTHDPVFDPSLFVDIRKRLGNDEFDKFNRIVIDKSERIKSHQARIKTQSSQSKENNQDEDQGSSPLPNKGTMKVDATIADQEITFPTDLKLLNVSRENLERIIDLVYEPETDGSKPRDYRRVARKDFLTASKKKRKSKKQIRKAIKSQLQYIARDLRILDKLLKDNNRIKRLDKRDQELLAVIRVVYEQQKYMYDNNTHQCDNRIVNIYQPYVRPMVRGKDKNKVEFGSKINISLVNGFAWIDRLSWDAYNEAGDIETQVKNYFQIYGRYPKTFLGDQIYLNRENRKFFKEKGIEIIGKPLGRPPKQDPLTASQKHRKKKKAAERNQVEGKFGQGKRAYGLNNIMARRADTSESMIGAIIFVMNLTQLLKVAGKYLCYFCLLWEKVIKFFITRIKIPSQYNWEEEDSNKAIYNAI